MSTIIDKLNYLNETKNLIKEAIINKGVGVSDTDTFRSYSDKIQSIKTSISVKDEDYLLDYTNIAPIVSNITYQSINDIILLPNDLKKDSSLIFSIKYDNNNYIYGFGDNWFKIYDDKPMEVIVENGNIINYIDNVNYSYNKDTYLMYDLNNINVNGCLINYIDDGSQKNAIAYYIEKEKISEVENFDIIGNVNIENKIADKFSYNDYIKLPETFPSCNIIDCIFNITTSDSFSVSQPIFYRNDAISWGIYIQSSSKNFAFYDGSARKVTSLVAVVNETYWVRLRYDMTTRETKLGVLVDNGDYTIDTLPTFDDNVLYQTTFTCSSEGFLDKLYRFGSNANNTSQIFLGKINLDKCIIKIDDLTFWKAYNQGSIINSRICLSENELTPEIASTYNIIKYIPINTNVNIPEHDTYTIEYVDVPLYIDNYKTIGNINIELENNSKIVNGFSIDNYLETIPQNILCNNSDIDNWEMFFKIKYKSSQSIQAIYSQGVSYETKLYINSGKVCLSLSNSSGSYTIGDIVGTTSLIQDTIYYIKALFTGTKYELYLSTNNSEWNLEGSITSSTKISKRSDAWRIGCNKHNTSNYTYPFKGDIYINDCYIKVNGYDIWNGYCLSDNYLRCNYEGCPIIINKIAQGFYNNDFLYKDIEFPETFNTKMLIVKIYASNIGTAQTNINIYDSEKKSELHCAYIDDDKIGMWATETNSSVFYTIKENTWYWIALIQSGNQLSQYVLEDNNYTNETLPEINDTNWSKNPSVLSNNVMLDSNTYYIGGHHNSSYRNQYVRGKIDLNTLKFYCDNEEINKLYYPETTKEMQFIKNI